MKNLSKDRALHGCNITGLSSVIIYFTHLKNRGYLTGFAFRSPRLLVSGVCLIRPLRKIMGIQQNPRKSSKSLQTIFSEGFSI